MNRIISFLLVLTTASVVAACSATSKSAQPSATSDDNNSQKNQSTPSWFSKETVSYSADAISAFGTAIGTDSSATVAKAEKRAVLLLKKSVSDKLEEVRSEAVKELGSDSGLNTPSFLIALRKVDSVVPKLSSTANKGVEPVKNQESVRGFAEVSVSKKELIEDIGRRLAAHERAWNNLKGSASFEKF